MKRNPIQARGCSLRRLKRKTIKIYIFVSGLPLVWSEDDIKLFFSQFDRIIEVVRVKEKEEFNGVAFVKFTSLTRAEIAIEQLRGHRIMGSQYNLNIKWLDTEQNRLQIKQNDKHKLFIGNLPRQASEQSLYKLFSIFGPLQPINLNKTQYWAFVNYQKKQSALLAIKHFNGQAFIHGARIPIDVRFKQKKYNATMQVKRQKYDHNPYLYAVHNIYQEINEDGLIYYFCLAQCISDFRKPPPGAVVYKYQDIDDYDVQPITNPLKDINMFTERKRGPKGANLFVKDLPLNLKESEIYNMFEKFGEIIYLALMLFRDGKSRGGVKINYANTESAKKAIQTMNGHEMNGKKLRVQLNLTDILKQQQPSNQVISLMEANF